MRYLLHLAYNGSNYHGWQIQPKVNSVQQELEKCLSLKLCEKISVTGCGRTDTGVHARSYYAHFDLSSTIEDTALFAEQMNAFLPADIVIYGCTQVADDFNARFSALKRTYRYYITQTKNPFHLNDAYYRYGNLDIDMMNAAARTLFEYTDFTSFSKLHTQVKTNNCKIFEARWFREDALLVFEISADRFLRNMVRAIVGTLIDVGAHKLDLDGFRRVIEGKDRCMAGTSVPAHALFLESVEYDETLNLK